METEIGKVTYYNSLTGMAVLTLNHVLKLGDRIRIHGELTDCFHVVDSLQIRGHDVASSEPGDQVLIRVDTFVREHDSVHRVGEGISTSLNVTL
jgi:hypothetical protein